MTPTQPPQPPSTPLAPSTLPPPPRTSPAAPPALPIRRSLFAAEAISALLFDAAGVADAECVLLRSLVNDVYQATVPGGSGPAFVVKVYRAGHRSAGEVEWEQRLAAHLAAAGLAVPEPVRRPDGRFAGTVAAPEGERAVAVTGFVPGGKPAAPFTAGLYRAFGTLVATFHRSAAVFGADLPRRTACPVTGLQEAFARLAPVLAATDPGRHALVADLTARALDRLGSAARAGLVREGVCHGDVTLDNVLIRPDGGLALYDFDLAGPGWPAADLTGVHATPWWDVFAAAYEEVWPLPAAELDLVPWLEVAGTVGNVAFHLVDKPMFAGAESVAEGWAERDLSRLAVLGGKLL